MSNKPYDRTVGSWPSDFVRGLGNPSIEIHSEPCCTENWTSVDPDKDG